MHRSGKFEKLARCSMYAGLTAAGVAGIMYPSELVQNSVSEPVVYFWTISMALSSLFCFWGSVRDLWIGEFSALPLLVAVLILYGFVTIEQAGEENPARWAYGFLIISYACGLVARWRYINGIRIASHVEDESKQRGV